VTALARLTVAIDAAAMGRVGAFVAAFAAEHGLCADDCARTLIVLEELITNLRKYGYGERPRPGIAEIALSLEAGPRLVVELVDEGRAFDPFASPAPDLDRPLDALPVGGLGLHIVRALTEGRHYRRVEGRNVTQLILHVELSDT
jgi:serine/threonine-protein kinase RsbW